MKEFKCEPYETSVEFVKYLNGLSKEGPFECPYLRVLPENIKIVYKNGPPRKYNQGGLFCEKKTQRTIEGHCGFGLSSIRQKAWMEIYLQCVLKEEK